MFYLDFVVLAAPAITGLVGAFLLGPGRGTLFGGIAMLVAVLFLLLFQVAPSEPGRAGSETSRFGYAFGLMMFEWYRWLPSFLAGSAVGSLIDRARRQAT